MGLAVGIFWIIAGLVYVVYKFCIEKLGQTPTSAATSIGRCIGILIVVGVVLSVISKSDIATLALQLCLAIGGCVLLVNIFKWEMEAHKDSVKEEQLPSEVTKDNVAEQARRVCQYSDGSKN